MQTYDQVQEGEGQWILSGGGRRGWGRLAYPRATDATKSTKVHRYMQRLRLDIDQCPSFVHNICHEDMGGSSAFAVLPRPSDLLLLPTNQPLCIG